MKPNHRWALLIAVLCVMASAPVRAQDRETLAEALFVQGRDAMKAQDYETACQKFRESNRLDPQVGTRLNLATCEKERGKLATAWALFKSVRADLAPDDDRLPIAIDHLASLEGRVPRVTLVLASHAPRDTVVRIGDAEVRGAGFDAPLPVDPGETAIVVTAPGHAERTIRITIAVGETRRVDVAPGAALPPTPKPAPAPSPDRGPPQDRGLGVQAVAGWTLIAMGVAAALAGGGTGIAGLVEKARGDDLCPAEACTPENKPASDEAHERARTLLTTTTVLWVAGGVVAAVGITVLLTADKEPRAALRVRPRGLDLEWRF